jgi:hypothetical protein
MEHPLGADRPVNNTTSKLKICSLLAGAALFGGCGSKHHLADYRFASRTLAVVYIAPPAPELLTPSYDIRGATSATGAVNAVVRAGAGAAKEREGRRATARLDSAAARINIPAVLAQQTLERASRYLGTRPVADPGAADYLLEVQMQRFGINAKGDEATYLFTFAEAVLLDRRTGREIWDVTIHGRDRLTPLVVSTSSIPGSVITAATIGNVSVGDFQLALNQLIELSSNLITTELRGALRDARDD